MSNYYQAYSENIHFFDSNSTIQSFYVQNLSSNYKINFNCPELDLKLMSGIFNCPEFVLKLMSGIFDCPEFVFEINVRNL